MYYLFYILLAILHIDNFQNNNHCENLTHFKMSKLSDLVGRLGIEEHILILNTLGYYYRFHHKVLLICTLTKLVNSLHYAVMADIIICSDLAR